MTVEKLKVYINQILLILAPIAAFTTFTKVDDIAVEALEALADSEAMLGLVANLFNDGDVDVPSELQAAWDEVGPALSPLRAVIKTTEKIQGA